MLFNSYSFLLFFLPICLIVYWIVFRGQLARYAVNWLLFCSILFYSWWDPRYTLLLLSSIALNYACAIGMLNATHPVLRRGLLLTGVTGNLALLGYFKYAMFAVDTFNSVAGTSYSIGQIVLPIGISFFTFQQIAFLVDGYREKFAAPRLSDFGLFVSFFPQLIAGPIVHHKQLLPQLSRLGKPALRSTDLSTGLTIFAIGLFKKVMIADEMAVHANPIFDAAASGLQPTFAESWIAALSYTLQLYFDFSGYSDMAIGIARMFAIRLPANFDSPYKATSVIDFWRRWHITLSHFLRDYVYIPLGGSRAGRLARYRNLMITMTIGGLWHGAGWTFLVWGVLHGLYLIVNHLTRGSGYDLLAKRVLGRNLYTGLCWSLTFGAVVFAWVLFRASNWEAAARMLSAMVGWEGFSLASSVSRLHALTWIPALLCVVLVMPNTQQIVDTSRPWGGAFSTGWKSHWPSQIAWRPTTASACLVAVLLLISILHMNRISEFVYYQF